MGIQKIWQGVTSSSDPCSTHNADMWWMSKAESGRWELWEVTGSRVGRMGKYIIGQWWIDMDVQVDAQADIWTDVRAELDVKDLDSLIQEKNVWEEEQRRGSILKLINMLGSLEGLPSLSLSRLSNRLPIQISKNIPTPKNANKNATKFSDILKKHFKFSGNF